MLDCDCKENSGTVRGMTDVGEMREPGEKVGGEPTAPDGRKESDGCFDILMEMIRSYRAGNRWSR